jgi:polysaccharide pyruvyl transferase WcaK-like protein
VRLLVGDLAYDRRVKGDLLRLLEESGSRFDPARIIDEPLTSPEDLCDQLAKTDMVVATRFHNVLLALMLGKPVIALSYHEKLRSLMAGVGAAEYSVDAEELDVPALIERFRRLSGNAEAFTSSIKQRTDEYRRSLDEQYAHMFGDLLGSRSGAAADDRYAARVA